MTSLYNIPVETIQGEKTTLAPFKGDVLLIVNVASQCAFSKQYQSLEALYHHYKPHGVSVLGFPCNQFLKQEPGNNAAIESFAKQCFRVTFPLFAKIDVKGKNQSLLYQYIETNIQKKPLMFVPWNFTKILVDQNGRVLRQFLPTTSMKRIQATIDNLLK